MRVWEAGLHGVEIHAAHGFLPAQFLSRSGNLRADEWGGPLENRARFVRTLAREIRAAVETGFIVGVRLSPEDEDHGIHIDETAQVAGWLESDGVDYVHLSLRDATALSKSRPGEHPVSIIRAKAPRVPLLGAGQIHTREDALSLVRRGVDGVAVGRAAILDPNWPRAAGNASAHRAGGPLTVEQLAERGVFAPFLRYIRSNWPELVAD